MRGKEMRFHASSKVEGKGRWEAAAKSAPPTAKRRPFFSFSRRLPLSFFFFFFPWRVAVRG